MRLIKPSSQGKAVQMLQELLQEQGYDLSVSGYFNIATTEAVRDFQEKSGLSVDAVVYTQTWTSLINKPPVKITDEPLLKKGASGMAVRRLQEMLNKVDHQLTIDGDFGPATANAVKDFQGKNGLNADGVVFTETWNVLISKIILETIEEQPTLKLGARGADVQRLQELLNNKGYQLTLDGDFGPVTDNAVKDFQGKNGLSSDGVVFTKTWLKLVNTDLLFLLNRMCRNLTKKDIAAFSEKYNIEIAIIKAVLEVESKGAGFLNDGQPIILFEGHIFWRELKQRGYDCQSLKRRFEDVLYSPWTKIHYKGGSGEWTRIKKAISIRPEADVAEAAYCSASYGLFQIMGFNYRLVGYYDVLEFVCNMKKNEQQQLAAFGEFLKANNLLSYLRNHQWAEFAKRYNGPDYKENHYDDKLKNTYNKFI
ncbi:MAG: N-acetylmuramidase domain-containing protein [Aequorivita sp.]